MKVYDCFTFFNEFELLELRLKTFYDLVDYFVIVEADKTHTNEPKPFNFLARSQEFQPYFKKIRYIMDNSVVPYKGVGDWSIENNQRNNIIQGLGDAEPDDLIFISDIDEFPNPYTIKTLLASQFDTNLNVQCIQYLYPEPYTLGSLLPFQSLVRTISLLNFMPLVCKQRFHCYYFDYASFKTDWEGTVIGKYKFMESPQAFRNARRILPRIVEGGYHFSYMGGTQRIISKMNSIVEGKERVVQDEKYLDEKFIEQSMADGQYFYGEEKFSPCDINDIQIPGLKDFLAKYPYLVKNPAALSI